MRLSDLLWSNLGGLRPVTLDQLPLLQPCLSTKWPNQELDFGWLLDIQLPYVYTTLRLLGEFIIHFLFFRALWVLPFTIFYRHLQDINIASNVSRVLAARDVSRPQRSIHVTALMASRGLLWVGTNVGIALTVPLPRLEGVPIISGRANISYHAHFGSVTFFLNLQHKVLTTEVCITIFLLYYQCSWLFTISLFEGSNSKLWSSRK